jgi:hypothetical protein
MHRRSPLRPTRTAIAVLASGILLATAIPASAVQTPHASIVSAQPVSWTPNVMDGQVNAILQMGQKVIVGGTFTQVQRAGTSQTLTRNHVFAFDMFSGAIDSNFVPQLPGPVEALAPGPDGQSVFVGGAFNSVNGDTNIRRLVRLNLSNGQAVTTFRANTNSAVLSLVLRGSWLYVSGRFTSIRNTPRAALARVDPVTGVVDPNLDLPFSDPQLGGNLSVRKFDVTPDGSRLVAIGNFSRVAGLPRNQMAMVNLSTTPATVSSWQTDLTPFRNPANLNQTWCAGAFSTWMRDVDISPDGQYFVLVTTGAYRANRLCDTASRWETGAVGPGQQPTWIDWAGGDTFWSVGITGTAIYVGGHQRWMNNPYRGDNPGPGAVPREGIAALDPVNGLPFGWDPGRARGVGVFDLVGTPDGLWLGSDTDRLAGVIRRKVGFFPLAGGAAVPPNVTYGLPGDLYSMPATSGALVRRAFDGSSYGPPTNVNLGVDWSSARGAFALNGRLYTGQSNGTLVSRTFSGTSVGPATTLNLYGLQTAPPSSFVIPGTTTPIPAFSTHLANMTGMFFDNGRIYYTVSGQPRLFYRYFTPESQVVGANLFVASVFPGQGVDWANVRGMTLAGGNLYFALANGNLHRVAWGGAAPTGPVTQLGGPGMDGANWASRGLFVFSQSAGPTPPTAPGRPTGVSNGLDSIDLSWQAASSPNQPLAYRIYRDGNPTPIGTVQSSSTTTVGLLDSGLTPGSTHTYTVDAVDSLGTPGPMSPVSDPITVMSSGAFFADDFSSGTFGAWTNVTRLTIDGSQGAPSVPSARGAPSGQSAFAFRDLGASYSSACLSARMNVSAQAGQAIDLFRLRTASGGPIAKVFVNANGILLIRSDAASTQRSSGVALGSGWHHVELCGAVGSSGSWDLYRDGVRIVDAWTANTGTVPIGRVQIGDTAAKTWVANWDDVVLDAVPG